MVRQISHLLLRGGIKQMNNETNDSTADTSVVLSFNFEVACEKLLKVKCKLNADCLKKTLICVSVVSFQSFYLAEDAKERKSAENSKRFHIMQNLL